MPRAGEIAALPGAVADLARFANFSTLFGLAGLPYDQVLQALGVGNDWTTMPKATLEWEVYSRTQEGECWANIRSIMAQLMPAWLVATAANPSLAVTYASLARLFGARKAITQKGSATKRANKAATAAGEPATHGLVGKVRAKRAAKALVAAAAKSGTTPPTRGCGGSDTGGHAERRRDGDADLNALSGEAAQ